MLKTYCVKMSIVRRASLSALCSLSGHGSVLQAASSSYRKTEATTLSTRTQFVRHNKINQKNYIYIYICSWLADLPYHRHASYKEWWCRDSEFSNQGWETPTRCQFLEAKKNKITNARTIGCNITYCSTSPERPAKPSVSLLGRSNNLTCLVIWLTRRTTRWWPPECVPVDPSTLLLGWGPSLATSNKEITTTSS